MSPVPGRASVRSGHYIAVCATRIHHESIAGSPHPTRENHGKVPVFNLENGEALLVEPIDARELIASGEYTLNPPTLAPL